MSKEAKSQTPKYDKIIIVAVIIVASFGVAYMVYDYVTTMEQLDGLKDEMVENSPLTRDPSIDSVLNDGNG